MKGIKSEKILQEDKQLCAGNKIKWKRPVFYEYEGAGKNISFKKIKRIISYQTPRDNVQLVNIYITILN